MSHMSDTDDTGYIDLFGKHLKDTMATLLLNDYPDILKNFPIHPILEHTDSRYFEWIHLLNLSGHYIAAAGGGSFHWRSNGKSVTVISLRFLNDIWLIISDNW